MNVQELKPVVEAILMAAEEPLSVERLGKLLEAEDSKRPHKDTLNETLAALKDDYAERGVELAEVASGYRFRARAEYAEQVGRLWEERRPRYTRAFLETLAIIAYRQPITRGEIEHIRGVAVSSNIMRQLLEREWVRVVGHRDVPGRPSVYATTNPFLDYFGLKSLDDLPTLADLKDIDAINVDLFAENMSLSATGEAATTGSDDGTEDKAGANEPVSAQATENAPPTQAIAGAADPAAAPDEDAGAEDDAAEDDAAEDDADTSVAAG